MKITSKVTAWTNICFLEMSVEYNGKEYEWEGLLDGKLSTYEVTDENGPIEDKEIWMAVSKFAIQVLDTQGTQAYDDLNDRLRRISYEG